MPRPFPTTSATRSPTTVSKGSWPADRPTGCAVPATGQSSGPPGALANAAWIEAFLRYFNFVAPPIRDPSGQACVFNSRGSTLTDVIDTVQEQAPFDGYLLEASDIRSVAVGLYQESRGPAPSLHFSISYAFVPLTGHADLATGATSRDLPGHQLGGTFTFQLHRDDEPGWELSVLANVRFVADDGGNVRLQNVMAGGQAAWVIPFAQGLLQAGLFPQVVGGAAMRQHRVEGSMRVTTDPSAQASGGAQLLFVIPGTDRHVMVGVQGGPGWTGALAPPGRSGPITDSRRTPST